MTSEEFSGYARRYGDTVYRVALNACGCTADAEDIMQTVLLKLYKEPKPFCSEEHVRRWLIRVALNESRKLTRSAWFKRRAPLEDWAGTVELENSQSELLQAVMSLPKNYRVPIYLHYYEGYQVKEVAKLCGIPESTAQTRLQRARQRLKEILTDTEEVR